MYLLCDLSASHTQPLFLSYYITLTCSIFLLTWHPDPVPLSFAASCAGLCNSRQTAECVIPHIPDTVINHIPAYTMFSFNRNTDSISRSLTMSKTFASCWLTENWYRLMHHNVSVSRWEIWMYYSLQTCYSSEEVVMPEIALVPCHLSLSFLNTTWKMYVWWKGFTFQALSNINR